MNKEHYFKSYCSGCGLCHSVNGESLVLSKNGFLMPESVNEAFSDTMCPASAISCHRMCESEGIWGDYISVKRGYSSDSELRLKASSGGVLSEIASWLLDKNKVDGIIHTGIGDAPLSTKTFCSTTRAEVVSHAGSRYIQSSPLAEISHFLQTDKKYAFIGKPCDVIVLRNFLDANPKYSEKFPYLLSFFCAGIPSLNANKKLIHQMGCKSSVQRLDYRGNGWPGYATVTATSGEQFRMAYEDAWGHILGRDKHKLCRLCMDGIGLAADIVCADGWYIKDGKPDFAEADGRNIIISRTTKGDTVLQEMEKEHAIVSEEYLDFDNEMPVIQKYQFDRRTTMMAQLLALHLCWINPIQYRYSDVKKYRKYSKFSSRKRIFWGTLKRIYRGRYR